MTAPALASLQVVVKFVASCIDDQDWYLNYLNQTTSNFPPKIQVFISETDTEDYAAFYTDKNNLNTLFVKGLAVFPGSTDFIHSVNLIPLDKISEFIDPFLENLSQLSLDDLGDQVDDEDSFDMTEEENEALRDLIRWGLITLKDITCLMVFGERIFSLVQKAIAGDVDAFAKVIQIDPSAAKHIPEFKLMIGEAYAAENSDLIDAISYRRNNFVGRSKLNYHHIFILFYLLDMLQLLTRMSNREVLDLYINSGFNTYEEILEVKTVADRRKFYLRSKI